LAAFLSISKPNFIRNLFSGTIFKGEFLSDSTELEWQWQKMLAGTFGSENGRKWNQNLLIIKVSRHTTYYLFYVLNFNRRRISVCPSSACLV
jgi:hypothetical protein